MKVAVTGAHGFVGRRVVDALRSRGHEVLPLSRSVPEAELLDAVRSAAAVVHAAGVNRPTDPREFVTGNAELTERVAAAVDVSGGPIVLYTSSLQAPLDNDYGRSKRRAELALEQLGARGARVAIFRLPNVFGPGARPNYNSAVATFAHNAARGLPLEIHDASRELTLVYVHDVATRFADVVEAPPAAGAHYLEVAPRYTATVGELASTFAGYAAARQSHAWPAVQDDLSRRLYACFLSYLRPGEFGYDLEQRVDARGALAEFLKSPSAGQIFVSRTKPGVTRGNHFHHTKAEKFLVLEGEALIRFRPVGEREVSCYRVSGRDFRVVDIPPDHTHSIENVGPADLIVLFWASEIFDPQRPDTYPLDVLS